MELQGAQLRSMTLVSFLLWLLLSSLSHCTVSCSSRSGSAFMRVGLVAQLIAYSTVCCNMWSGG